MENISVGLEVEITCAHCGTVLNWDLDYNFRNIKEMRAEPCPSCLDDAADDAYEDAYEDGYEDGYREAEDDFAD